jgi:hypothetical protein
VAIVCGDGVKEMKEVETMTKMNLPQNPRLLVEYIGGDQLSWKGIAALNCCHLWRYFPDGDHTAHMQGHTGRMRSMAATCDLGWAYGPSVSVKTWSRARFLRVLA